MFEVRLKELAPPPCLEDRREVRLERKAAFGPDHEGRVFMTV